MSSWTRLTEGTDAEFEQLLLDSAQGDLAPLASRQQVATGLGVDLARVEASAALLRSAPRSDVLGPTRAGLEPASAGALVKYTLIALIGGLAAVGSMSKDEAVSAPIRSETSVAAGVAAPSSASNKARSAAVRDEPEAPLLPVAPGEAPELVEPPAPAPAPRRPARTPAAQAPAETASSTALESSSAEALQLEVEQLDRVRAALGSGRSQEALRALDDYRRRFPRGLLGLEATVLRIRTLERAGRFSNAARLARRALELPGSERYHAELARVAGSESTQRDKEARDSTLQEPR